MNFQKDYKFLYFRIIILFLVVFLFLYFGNKIFKQYYHINYSFNSLIIMTIITNVVFNYFLVYEVFFENKIYHFKNIYKCSLEKIHHNNIAKMRIHQKSINSKIILLFMILGSKYENTIWLTIQKSNSENFSCNGHILSNKGLKSFSLKTKR